MRRDGFFFVTGRLKELIIKGGENIAPREIDEALLRHPALLEAAAVGAPDPLYGQDIEAGVVVKPGMTVSEPELLAFCEQQLGRFRTPRTVHILTELPKGPSGKVQRLRLSGAWAVSGSAATAAIARALIDNPARMTANQWHLTVGASYTLPNGPQISVLHSTRPKPRSAGADKFRPAIHRPASGAARPTST